MNTPNTKYTLPKTEVQTIHGIDPVLDKFISRNIHFHKYSFPQIFRFDPLLKWTPHLKWKSQTPGQMELIFDTHTTTAIKSSNSLHCKISVQCRFSSSLSWYEQVGVQWTLSTLMHEYSAKSWIKNAAHKSRTILRPTRQNKNQMVHHMVGILIAVVLQLIKMLAQWKFPQGL